jgi:hypothetical protein
MSETVVVTVPERRRWQWWRDIVILMLAVAVGAQVVGGIVDERGDDAFQARVDARGTAAAADREKLAADLAREQSDDALAQAEIRRLTDLLLSAGVDPGKPLTDTNRDGDVDLGSSNAQQPSNSASPQPTSTPTRRTRTSAPRPTGTSRPSPPPSPSPTPTCQVSLAGVCLLR